MDRLEATRLTELVEQMCPAQKINNETPAVWAGLLRDVRLVDALEAVRRLGMRQPFVSPADIVAEVLVVRAERLDGIDQWRGHYRGDPDDARAEIDWWRGCIRRIGDGERHDEVFEPQQLTARKMPALDNLFRKVPEK